MGQVSYLEDIQERLDEAVARFTSRPDVKRGSISIESLLDTNDRLRRENDELMKLIYEVKVNIEWGIKQKDFCGDECIRLRQMNARLRRKLETHQGNDKSSLKLTFKVRAPGPHQPEKVEPTSQHVQEAKQRFHDAEKVVGAAKENLKQAEKVRAKAQDEYQRLVQSERHSTKYIHDTGQGRRQ